MSASTELLLEQIKLTEEEIVQAQSLNDNSHVAVLQFRLTTLQKQLSSANNAITEGKTILKG